MILWLGLVFFVGALLGACAMAFCIACQELEEEQEAKEHVDEDE